MERDYVLRPVHPNQARNITDSARDRAERLLFYIPMFTTAAVGLIYMSDRFILVLRDNLKENPESFGAVMFLAVLVGSVSILIVLACSFIGAVIGYILSACFAKRLSVALRRMP